MVLKDSCNQLIIDLNDDQAEFLSLIDKVSAFDREHLQGSFTKLEAKFEQLEQEFTRIARSITQDQHSTCTNFLTEVRNKITPLKKEIKTCLRTPGSVSATTENTFSTISNDFIRSFKTDKDFEPEKLNHQSSHTTYIQWRKDMIGYFTHNQLYKKPIPTQRRYLRKYLDTYLKNTLDGEANEAENFPLGPPLTSQQQESLASGGEYPVPIFPAAKNCLIGVLDSHFNLKEPKMMRLHNYNNIPHQYENESFYEAWTRIYNSYQNSGIASVTEEERLKAKCIAMTRNKQLQLKLLEQDDTATLDHLLNIGKNWQSASTCVSQLQTQQTAIAAKTSGYKRHNSKQRQSIFEFINSMKQKGLCFRCNSEDCKTSSGCIGLKTKCQSCNKFGHITSLCQSPGSRDGPPQKMAKQDPNQKSVFERLGGKDETQ